MTAHCSLRIFTSRRLVTTYDEYGARARPFVGTSEQLKRLITSERPFKFDDRVRTAKIRKLQQVAERAADAAKIKAVGDFMSMLLGRYFYYSTNHIDALMLLIEREPAEAFWPIFMKWWIKIDCVWDRTQHLVETLHRVGPCRDYTFAKDKGAFFDSLPDQLTVYRGASRAHIQGALSWTTSINVARNFARGHRKIAVNDPVIATGKVDKSKIFLATNDRAEREILALPTILKVRDFRGVMTIKSAILKKEKDDA
jgi:hypothetical protein